MQVHMGNEPKDQSTQKAGIQKEENIAQTVKIIAFRAKKLYSNILNGQIFLIKLKQH